MAMVCPAAIAAPDDGREYTTVLEEDFSLCTAGSEENPDPTIISTADFQLPAKYTHAPGWGGRAVMSAGGMICIGRYTDSFTQEEMTGQIDLPELDLHRDQGTAYLTFRARLLAVEKFDMITVRWTAETDMLPVTGEEQTIAVSGQSWSTYEVTLTKCPENAVIQIYTDENELLIDDIKVEQFKPEVEAPKALKWTEFTGDSFKAHWTKVANADHYVFNCYYVRREGTEDTLPSYKYVAKNVELTDTCYQLTNLNIDKVHYYYVRAVSASGVVSEESQLVEVLDLTVPSNIKVKNVSTEGFRVTWDPVHNAEGYGFQAILDHTAPADEDYALLDESFDVIESAGEIGSPYVNTVGLYDMDSYGISRANWVMYEGGVINGGLALRNTESSYGETYYGELVSPIMSIGQSTGEITFEADYATLDGVKPYIQIAVPGVVNGVNQWVRGAGGEIEQEIGETWTHVKQTYKVKPGLIRFSFGCTDGGWLYMDNVKLSVRLPKGATQRLLYLYNEIKDNLDSPSYYCETPDRKYGDEYSFALMAARQRPGTSFFPIYVNSKWSELMQVPHVDMEWDGIREVTAESSLNVSVSGNVLTVSNPTEAAVVVTTLSGRTAGRTSASSATFTLAPGVYIVSAAGSQSVKVLIK